MSRPRYYTPQLRRDLVTRLYFAAKAQNIPMTVLSNQMVEEGLERLGAERVINRIAEEPIPPALDG